jgi:hypothetical protein
MKWWIHGALLAVPLCIVGQFGWAEDFVPEVQVLPDEIVGVVVYPDGETPVIDLPVRVWSLEKNRMLYRTKTDDEGAFRVPSSISGGKCYLFVGKLSIDLEILHPSKDVVSQRHDLIIVEPRWMTVTTGARLFDVLLAPVLMQVPDSPRVVSP